MSRFDRLGEGRGLGSALTERRSRWRWDLPTLLKVAVAVLLVGWMWASITDLEGQLRDANRARDTLARELRQLRAAPVSGLAGNAERPADTGTMNAPSPAGQASPAVPPEPPGKDGGTGEKKKDGMPGTEGAEGKPGPAGRDGDPGNPGPGGPSGEPGVPGPVGKDGKDGDPGPPGKDGKDGKEGKDGDPGPPGPPGKDGDRGPEGPPGPVCPDGFSLQVPRWDYDALVCRRDHKRAESPSTRSEGPAPAVRREALAG